MRWATGCVLALSIALTACGGGGDSNADVNAPTSTNVYAALQALLRQAHSFNLSGTTSAGVALTAIYSDSIGPTRSDGTTNFDSTVVTLQTFYNGAPAGTSSEDIWEDVGTPNPAYNFASSNTCEVRSKALAQLPALAVLGTSAVFQTTTTYDGCDEAQLPTSASAPIGTSAYGWSYSIVNGLPAVCLNVATTLASGTGSQSDCIEIIDTAGTLGAHFLLSVKNIDGTAVTFTN